MRGLFVFPAMLVLFLLAVVMSAADDTAKPLRKEAGQLLNEGNYKDAYQLFSKLALGGETEPKQIGEDLQSAVTCLRELNRQNEQDELIENVIAKNPGNWTLLTKSAKLYRNADHFGLMVSDKFERGQRNGNGKYINSTERDRMRSLQLYLLAMPIVLKEGSKEEKFNFYSDFAYAILEGRIVSDFWQMQSLSDINILPDYEEGYGYGSESRGAPVDENGNPIYYKVPADFTKAKSDGERWRWLLEEAIKAQPSSKDSVLLEYARVLAIQFDVGTMVYYGSYYQHGDDSGGSINKDESGPYSVHTLTEDETIARLATGIKRFKLPDEYNYIKIWRQILADNNEWSSSAIDMLAGIFKNRRQYPKAAELLRESIKRFGDSGNYKKNQLDQIIGSWGQFTVSKPFAAGKPAELEFVFRNAKSVSLEAFKIKVPELINDIKKYLKLNPAELDSQFLNINGIGQEIVWNNLTKYVGEKVAAWDLQLQPSEAHFNRTIEIKTPLKEAGAYLVIAKLPNGNVSRIVVWLNDAVIVEKQGNNGVIYYVSDAVTGAPRSKIKLDFFGYQQKAIDRKPHDKFTGRYYNIKTQSFTAETNDDGIIILGPETMNKDFQWLAETSSGVFLGFDNVWYGKYYDREYNKTKTYIITDRPAYRPEQEVNFKIWVRKAKYDQKDVSDFANRSFAVVIRNPKNEEIYKKTMTADQFGGIEDKIKLSKSAALGVYNISIEKIGGYGHFRVEEYKKPEYEVTVETPKEPVKLGDKITATIEAKYYFGAPVTDANVKYKVQRYIHNVNWYPPMRWDWFYGPGYWWFAGDYDWYPGWREWGCKCPRQWWMPLQDDPPELVMENEVRTGSDGKVKIEIDSSTAKALHGDQDHRYEISAEVTDQSRRTIFGKGSVIAARKPFSVYGWVDKGFYQVGDAVNASFAARTVDGKPVKGTGSIKLFKIRYNADGEPSETIVQNWEAETNGEGLATLQLKAAKKGQYRLLFKLQDAKDNSAEGGYIFTVHAPGEPDNDFRFNDIELVNDKTEYKDGDTARIMIRTNQPDSTVLFFVRPANGVYLSPKVMRLKGKTAFEEIKISLKDMPNFFVEAMTVSNGKIFTAVKELVVPPEKRMLNVEVIPSKEKYKPGEKAKAKIRITDFSGKPLTEGSAVVTVYDKSVEYISGGSNVPEIKDFFWKWRRSHYLRQTSNLDHFSRNLIKDGEIQMRPLGIFGDINNDNDSGNGETFKFGGLKKKMLSSVSGSMTSAGAPVVAFALARSSLKEMDETDAAKSEVASSAGEDAEMADVAVRKNFADTAFWSAKVTPDANGEAEIELAMPENLTTWKIKVWAMTHGTKVGQGETEVMTSKDFIVRLQAPRFFIEKDEVVLSAVIHNYYKDAKSAKVALELEGGNLFVLSDPNISGNPSIRNVKIDPNGEIRVDWRVTAAKDGEAIVRMKAVTDNDSDAMEMKFPVYVHGMLKTFSFSGNISAKENSGAVDFAINVPAERRPDASRLEVRFSPSLACAMVDALPYLCDYPYGCTEHTINRFLPAVITQKVLKDMGLNLKEIKEKRTNLNAQETGDDKARAKQWKTFDRNPVFDEELLKEMVADGLKALAFMQLSDGGWGWFSGWGEYSSPHTTATVVHGLQIAKLNGVKFDEAMLKRGVDWLNNYQNKQVARTCRHEYPEGESCPKDHPKDYRLYADNLDALIYMILTDAGVKNKDMKFLLYRDRTKLGVYAKAMFGIALRQQNDAEKLSMIMKNIEQYLEQDDENQTAYLKLGNEGFWWCWYGSESEANAYYLKLLAATEPKSEKASRLVKYLLNNRKHATYWNSTRDTALCLEAMADYIRASGEDKPEMTVEVLVDGKPVKTEKINRQNIFTFDNKFVLEGKNITGGAHKIEIRKTGTGPLYCNAYLSYFSLEDYKHIVINI